jgi:hypothetical protein
MPQPRRFGVRGIAACLCSLCLSTFTALPQDAKSSDAAANDDSEQTSEAARALRQLQEQNSAVLKAVERLQDDADAALGRYTAVIGGQLDALKTALLLQRDQEFQTARAGNRVILTLAAGLAGAAVLIMLLSALLPLWAVRRIAAAGSPRGTNDLFPGLPAGWSGAILPLEAAGHEASLSDLDGIVGQIEQRLAALEKKATEPPALPKRPVPNTATPLPAKSETPVVKRSYPAHVAITLGAGEAISFLPRDAALTGFHSFWAWLGGMKRKFKPDSKPRQFGREHQLHQKEPK